MDDHRGPRQHGDAEFLEHLALVCRMGWSAGRNSPNPPPPLCAGANKTKSAAAATQTGTTAQRPVVTTAR